MAAFAFENLEVICKQINLAKEKCFCYNINFYEHGQKIDFCAFLNTTSEIERRKRIPHIYGDNIQNEAKTKDIVFAAIIVLVSIVGILGNSIVLMFPQRKKKSTHLKLTYSLASTDLISSVTFIVLLTPTFWTKEWVYGEVGCKTLLPLMLNQSSFAIGIILIIAIERFFGIVKPFKIGISTNFRCMMCLAINFVLAFCSAIPYIKHLHVNPETEKCTEMWKHGGYAIIYSGFILVFFFIVPIITIGVLYWKIIVTLKNQALTFKFLNGSYVSENYAKRIEYNKRTIKNLFGVVLLFVLFNLPNKVKWIIFDTSSSGMHGTENALTSWYKFVSNLLAFFRVLINPLVYTFSDKRFRSDVWGFFITKLICRRRKQRQVEMEMGVRRVINTGLTEVAPKQPS
ncbi:QRFP-like peptide receptor [Clytia hemisphaerica]|uniref:QRFP-like peptide receptor n=1 Tax=Clytia hemisphaerica TaxID=252671 RepID=UPI0034D424CF